MKKIILICGLIRKPEILEKSLIIYNQLLKEGIIQKIILCTDKQIKDKQQKGSVINTKMREMLNYYNVDIVEHETLSIEEIKKIDPDVESKPLCKLRKKNVYISMWREMYNFKMGIINCDDNSFILKTRCDLFLSYNLIKKIFNNYIVKLKEKDVFEYKIWGGGFHYCEPLHIADYAFMGYKNDLLKAVSLEAPQFKWMENPAEPSVLHTCDTIWWIPIFHKKYPIIESFAKNIVGKYKGFQLIENPIFYKTVATQIFIMNKYFILDSGIDEYILFPSWGGFQIKNSSNSFSNYPITQNDEWIQNFINGKFNSNKIMKFIFDEYQQLI